MTPLRSKEWHEGYADKMSGKDVNACPYRERVPGHKQKYDDWVDGWNAAHADTQDRGWH